MDFQLLVTLTFAEMGSDVSDMNTKVLKFPTRHAAEVAYNNITDFYPHSAIYATVVKLY